VFHIVTPLVIKCSSSRRLPQGFAISSSWFLTSIRGRISSPVRFASRRAGCTETCSSGSRLAFGSNPGTVKWSGVIARFYLMGRRRLGWRATVKDSATPEYPPKKWNANSSTLQSSGRAKRKRGEGNFRATSEHTQSR